MAIAFDAFVHHHGGATWKRLGMDHRRRAAADSWRVFCAKYGISPDAKMGPAARELAARPFDPARDCIPLVAEDDVAAAGAGYYRKGA